MPTETERSTSLPEVHSSVGTAQPSIWRRMFAFAGPAYLVSVGYMDPGNWATDLEAGARFGNRLLWVLVMSNLMAILLQTLSARLGIVSRQDLAQACRDAYPKAIVWGLWVLCEIAITACDLAEVLGAAIGFNLLFHLPLVAGVLITACDTLLILWLTKYGIRVIEAFVLVLISVITICFLFQLFVAKPDLAWLAGGLIPSLDEKTLFIAIGILGATVMPHNLYLHSALVQTRQMGTSRDEKRAACRFNLIDSVVALNGALIVNAAILVVAATVFFRRGIIVKEIQQAHLLLAPLLGTTLAGVAFAVALLCAGQSSTITGTLAGQIVMEGFINVRVQPWLRRFITRLMAVAPAVGTILLAGDAATYQLLLLSQVILSMQLPFAVIPLVQFTSDKRRMGEFANPGWLKALAWFVAALIVGLNIWLVKTTVSEWLADVPQHQTLLLWIIVPALVALGLLLAWVVAQPLFESRMRRARREFQLPPTAETAIPELAYRNILVPLDHSDRDPIALSHAAALAKLYGATVHILHVEEGVTSNVYGEASATGEVESFRDYFNSIQKRLETEGVKSDLHVRHGLRPRNAIIAWARTERPDLIVMGAHGHRFLGDMILGATINAVRHELEIPILIVRAGRH